MTISNVVAGALIDPVWGNSAADEINARRMLDYASIGSAIGPITTVTDVSGLSVTWTADPGRLYLIRLDYSAYAFAINNIGSAQITDPSNVVQGSIVSPFLSNSVGMTVHGTLLQLGLSGSITRKVRYTQAAGSGGVYMGGGATLSVSDVGPV